VVSLLSVDESWEGQGEGFKITYDGQGFTVWVEGLGSRMMVLR